MTLMVNGKKVVGYALGGTEFYSIGKNADGSSNIGGQDYFNKNKMKITDTGRLDISFNAAYDGTMTITGAPIDVTSELSHYGGYLAMCILYELGNPYHPAIVKSQPFIIPTVPTTYKFSFEDSSDYNGDWGGSLSRTTDNKFTFTPTYMEAVSQTDAISNFYILSNN